MKTTSPRLKMVVSMLIFGTIGLLRRWIALPSALLAQSRGLLGGFLLLIVMVLRRQNPDFTALKSSAPKLLLSGALLGFNWILLFEAYRYTSVAAATICYYMAPVLILLVSPLLGEKLTLKKGICCLISVLGMVLVSGLLNAEGGSLRGILLGLSAAVLYAAIVLLNRRIAAPALDRTVVQLLVSSLVLVPYILLTEDFSTVNLTTSSLLLTLVAGFVHTGLAYYLYFGALPHVSAQTAAILSYLDPVSAVLLSALLLREPLGAEGVLGSVLVLGTMLVSEWSFRKR